MKRKFGLIFPAAVVVALFGASTSAWAQERVAAGSPANCSIELNGDSILRGYGVSTSPAQWLQAHGYPVDNRAIDGQSTWQLFRPNNFSGKPHSSLIVVIQTGINDYRREYESGMFPVSTVLGVKQDYRYMIDRVRALGKIPVVAGVTQIGYPNALGDAAYNTISQIRTAVKEVATEKNAHYASFDAVPVAWTDTIHLNQASSNGIAENLRYVASYICMLPF